MLKTIKFAILAAIMVLPLTAFAQSAERIVSYHSDIEVFKDSSMEVTETITVISAGQQIKRGIYRDFPIAYKDRLGQRYLVDFELLKVTRNGQPEPYHTEKAGNGIRIYIGKEDVFIPPGQHVYAITYKTGRNLGFFPDHDELYWNVTGNGWVFEINEASASIKLPAEIPQNKITAALYTGPVGSNAQNGAWQIGKGGAVEFKTTRPLGAYEGLTIVAGWPKGIILQPTPTQNFISSLKSNLDYIVGILGLLLVFGYYLYMWDKRGRDPKKGAIIAQYEAPQGLSPAMLRYISRMGPDNRAFAASIISLAVKKRLTITEEKGWFGKKEYTLTKKSSEAAAEISQEEQILETGFFKDAEIFKLEKSNAAEIIKVREDFQKSLADQTGKKYFVKNTTALFFGILLSAAVVALTVLAASAARFGINSPLQTAFKPILAIILVIVSIIFARLLRAYTAEGRKIADETEGFKLFLSVTEKDRLAFHNPPEKTPELFEKMLPFALALGVEHKWAQQFTDVFAQMESRGASYSPVWFYGSMAHFNANTFASDIGSSFTGAVTSASVPPGSSSGFSGGGSGGGGGGGGGGGW